MKRILLFSLIGVSLSLHSPVSACNWWELRNANVDSPLEWRDVGYIPIGGRPWSRSYGERWFPIDAGKDQIVNASGYLRANGQVSVEVEVRNGAAIDGDHFAVLIVLRGFDGEVVESGFVRGGANAAGVCKAAGKGHDCWRWRRTALSMNVGDISRISQIEVHPATYDTVDDGAVFDNLQILAECAIEAAG